MGKVKDKLAAGEIVTTRGRKPKKAEPEVQPEIVVEGKVTEKVDLTWKSERVMPMREKAVYEATPAGMVKVICLRDYVGMRDVIYAGDVYLLPERRYKSLQARGYVEPYDGEKPLVDKR